MNISAKNWGQLSETRVVGNPLRLNIRVNWSFTILVEVLFSGTASGHLVAMSIQINRYLKLPLATGNRPTMSTATRSDGTVTISLAYMSMCFGSDLSLFWHTSHDFLCLAAFLVNKSIS